MIKSIIFDCYGTLINTGNGSIKATEQILKKNKSYINPGEFYRSWKKLHHELCNQESFLLEETIFRIGLETLYKSYLIDGDPDCDVAIMLNTIGKRDIFPEIEDVLEKLFKRYLLVIGSNSDHQPLISDITRNKIKIRKVYSSESLGIYKPKGDFYTRILTDLGLRADEVLYVGDSQIEDIKGPYEVGIGSIWINRRNERLQEGIPTPLKECKDLKGLIQILC